MAQPAALLEAFGVIRQTRAVEQMREARHRALEWKRDTGGGVQ